MIKKKTSKLFPLLNIFELSPHRRTSRVSIEPIIIQFTPPLLLLLAFEHFSVHVTHKERLLVRKYFAWTLKIFFFDFSWRHPLYFLIWHFRSLSYTPILSGLKAITPRYSRFTTIIIANTFSPSISAVLEYYEYKHIYRASSPFPPILTPNNLNIFQ